jgi:PAS domain S-box-containing protein
MEPRSKPVPTAVSSTFWRAESTLSHRALAERLDAIVLASVGSIASGLALLYLLFAVFHFWLVPPPHNVLMMLVAFTTSLTLAGITVHSRKAGVHPRWGHPLSAAMILLVLFNSILHLLLTRNSYQTTNLMVLAIGMGCFLLSMRWMAYLTAVLLVSWSVVAFALAPPGLSQEWVHFGFALVTSTTLAWLVFFVRRRNLVRLERLAWQQHQTMRRAQEGESRFYQLANATSEGVVIHDHGLIVDVNERLLEMFATTEDEMIGRRVTELVARKDRDLLRSSGLNDTHDVRLMALRPEGTHFPVAVRMRSIRMRDKELFVIAIRDLTESYEVGRLKDEFVATVSHELRTPLTSIRGALALLQPDQLVRHPEKAARLLEVANTNIERLVRLINDLLDLQRMESGQITLRLKECVTTEIVRQVVMEMSALAQSANIRVETMVTPIVIKCDPDRILQALTNLINNAIKFSENGSTIVVECEPVGDDVRFKVKDQGRGIPADKLDTVFDRFLQLDGSDARRIGGTGLGLSICRTIILQHRGRIWAESSGQGSTFAFTLPRSKDVEGTGESGSY